MLGASYCDDQYKLEQLLAFLTALHPDNSSPMSTHSTRISKHKKKKSSLPKGFRQARVWTAEELARKDPEE
jgi:hypothetical protein